jgi:hypothetical protein
VAGHDPGLAARRAATVAAGAFADATAVSFETGSSRGVGLRGGRFRVTDGRFTLTRVRFVGDATVTGSGTSDASDGGVRCRLTVRSGRRRFSVALRWDQRSRYAVARVGGARLRLPAP